MLIFSVASCVIISGSCSIILIPTQVISIKKTPFDQGCKSGLVKKICNSTVNARSTWVYTYMLGVVACAWSRFTVK